MNELSTKDLLATLILDLRKVIALLDQPKAAPRPTPQETQLATWQKTHPQLAVACKEANTLLTDIYTEYLERLTTEIIDSADAMMDSDFMLNDFVDRYGNRAFHLNSMLVILSQLSSGVKP
ncbi:MAG: hypothetical protein ACYSW8_25330 [Planctomycetota bacterium]|jgi:hypothetical protein